jgi:TetR/AcrR family transcriptional repressor of nem operon
MAAGRPRSFDEADVLEHATQVFWTQGFEATSVADLEAATGLGRQSLYNAFGGKRALYQACLKHYEQTRAAGFGDCLAAAPDPLAAVEGVVRSWAQSARQTGCRGCLFLNAVSEFGGRDPDLLATVTRVLDAQQRALADCLRAAQRAGQLAPEADPTALARRLQATSHGLQLMSRLDPDDGVLDDIVRDTLASLGRRPAA